MSPARDAPAPSRFAFLQTSFFAALAIAAAALAAYANSFAVPFVFDDELAIVANPSLQHLGSSWSPPPDLQGLPISGRPIVNFSFGVSHALSGTAVWSYHALNLLIHALAGLTLFAVLQRTLQQPALAPRFGAHAFGLALSIALLWTLHPLQTESVTYISQRAEALLGLFYLLTLWCFIRALGPGAARGWIWAALVVCLLGMLTKEVMASAPLFAALYARAFAANSWRETWQRHRRALLTLASAWLVLIVVVASEGAARGVSAGFGLGVSPWTYLLKQCDALVLYLKLSLWPHPLVLDYGTALVHSLGEVWWQALLLVLLFGATLWAVVRKPIAALPGAWFFPILAPSSSVVPLVGQTVAEHRMYLPLAAVIVVLALGAYRLLGRAALAVLAVVVVALGVTTARRNQDYASAIRICTDTVTKQPGNARAMALLADYLRRAGRLPEARRWLERSLELQPNVRPVLNNLGNVWQALGEPAKAVTCFEQALALRPDDAVTLNNLGTALLAAGRVAEGIARLEAAARAPAASWELRFNLASALAQNGRAADAAMQFETLVQARPDDADIRSAYSDVLSELGRKPEALAQLAAAAKARPSDANLHDRLGVALGRAGRFAEALAEFQTALRLNPNDETARQNAAIAQRRLGGN